MCQLQEMSKGSAGKKKLVMSVVAWYSQQWLQAAGFTAGYVCIALSEAWWDASVTFPAGQVKWPLWITALFT